MKQLQDAGSGKRDSADATTITVMIVDDQALIRNGFKLLLETFDGIRVVGEAADGFEAFERATTLVPDVILMDIRMPRQNGIEATRRILNDPRCSNIHIIILTTFDIDEYVYEALRVGASGFLLKDIDPEELVKAVEVVAAGEALLAPSITRRLISEFVKVKPEAEIDASRLDALTEREREVLLHIARGLSNSQIAEELFISPATAKTHVARIMTKLNVHDRAQLVVVAYETGLVVAGNWA